MTRRPARSRYRVVATVLLAVYLLALTLIAFWPQHVDRGAGPFLGAIRRVLPWATYDRVEFASNVLLFVPLGLLLMLSVGYAWKVLLTGFAATVAIELVQALLPDRTSSVLDVIANTSGTVLGIVLAVIGVELFSSRFRERRTA